MLTIFGASALTFMMLMYALERRGRRFILAFAVGCALSSVYGFLAGTWPFGVVEAVWCAIALRRHMTTGPDTRRRQRGGSRRSGVGLGMNRQSFPAASLRSPARSSRTPSGPPNP